jgi:hypothetical protein
MMLTEAEKSFVDRRRHLIRSWPYVGSGMLVLMASLVVWLVITKPLLSNPFFAMSELARGAIDQSTLMLMAMLLPLAIWTALFICIVTVLLSFAAFSNERKYQALLEKSGGGEAPNAALQGALRDQAAQRP